MYKVFVNHKVVIITEKHDLEVLKSGMLYFQYDDFEEIHYVLNLLADSEELLGVVIQSDDVEMLWADFRAHFREIEAAGGLVRNPKGQILMIHRLGKWDLPKGKREPEESIEACALREVEEECGIQDLSLAKQLDDTYHTYTQHGFRILKRTYWFEMRSDAELLIPQMDEGIDKVLWMNPEQINWDHMETYPNIRLLMDSAI
jgi:8-oxo-dGTP pyrophosphatase MutT (NUDIX family)